MVRRLVEHEDVPAAHQKASQVYAAALPARKAAHRPCPGHVGKQACDDIAHGSVGCPLVLRAVPYHFMGNRLVRIERVDLAEQTPRSRRLRRTMRPASGS